MSRKVMTSLHAGAIGTSLTSREDMSFVENGFEIVANGVPYSIGGIKVRSGFSFVGHTKYHKTGRLHNYMYDYELTYELCFTDYFCRLLDNGGVQLLDEVSIIAVTITATEITIQTSAAHGYLAGDEIYISGLTDIPVLNNRFFCIEVPAADEIVLRNIKNTGYIVTTGTWVSGGSVALVYDVSTPYSESQLPYIKTAQKKDELYLVDGYNEPQKFSLNTVTALYEVVPFARTSDPFTDAISGITQANPAVVTTTNNHEYLDGETIRIRDVNGMSEVNGEWFTVTVLGATTFSLQDTNGVNIDSTGYTAYTSGGLSANTANQPRAIGFYGGRLFYGSTLNKPDSWWASMGPDPTTGDTQYDDLTTGSNDVDALYFVIQSQNNVVEQIRFFVGTPKYLAIGALGGVYKATGATGDSSAITANSISVAPVDYQGVADINPVAFSSEVYFTTRGAAGLSRFAYDIYKNSYVASDQSLPNEDLLANGILYATFQKWDCDIVWLTGEDGRLYGMSSKVSENQAWFYADRGQGSFVSVGGEINGDAKDNLWVITEQEINGETVRYIEFQAKDPVRKKREDFMTGVKATDTRAFINMYTSWAQQMCRLDCMLTNEASISPNATLTIGASTILSDTAIFESTDVGRLISVTFETGYETGLAEITAVNSATEVAVSYDVIFREVTLYSGEWMISTNVIQGLSHLEGEDVIVLADGGELPPKTVTNGCINFDDQWFRLAVGQDFTAMLKTVPLRTAIDQQGNPSFGKTTSVGDVIVNVRESSNFEVGDDLYNMHEATGFDPISRSGDPITLQTKPIVETSFSGYDRDKPIYITKKGASPLDILALSFELIVGEK